MPSRRSQKIAVYGYIRENFDQKCWIGEIIKTIIRFYVIKGGSLYVFGHGYYGQLGIEGDENDYCKVPTLCPPFTDSNAYKVSASLFHTLILDIAGNVWCCRYGYNGQLGNGKTDHLYRPTRLYLYHRVISVSAGTDHSLLLCDNGRVLSCGSNTFGELGLDGRLRKSVFPKTIEKLKKYKITQICAGARSSAVLTEGGDLFGFGDNTNGECGVGRGMVKNFGGEQIWAPRKVEMNDMISFVACTHRHALLITSKGLIYSFGSAFYERGGQLGHGDKQHKYTPTLIAALKHKRIKMCAVGEGHSLCVDTEGIIWSFGSNQMGQCGLSEDVEKQLTPKMIGWFIANNIEAKECAAGRYTSSVISGDGSCFVFGSNKYHQLGLEEEKHYFTPTKLALSQKMSFKSISMGSDHAAIICNN